MKNQHILNLKSVIPKNIRLEVYREALVHYKNGGVNGLCLILPKLLWELDDFYQCAPNKEKWLMEDVPKAFPEFKKVLTKINNSMFPYETRIKVLEDIIKKMTKKLRQR